MARLIILFVSFSLGSWSAFASTHLLPEADSSSLFEYFFAFEEEPVIKINTEFNKLVRKKMKEEEQPATFTFKAPSGEELTLDVDVRARGNIRKQVCVFPPLKVDFDKDDIADLGFKRHIDDLKLVLQCRNTGYSQTQLFREHLIYELYALIDSFHILTKPMRIEIWDGDKKKEDLQGLFVEDENQIAHRLNARILESANIRSGSLEREHYLKMAFFQVMALNTDWTIPNKHNVEIMKVPAYKRVIAVPYDFDYAGMVGTSYAVPHESLPIEDVRERYFMGFQVTEEEALSTAEYFLGMRSEFEKLVESRDYLDAPTKNEVQSIIEGFYQLLNDENRVKKFFVTK